MIREKLRTVILTAAFILILLYGITEISHGAASAPYGTGKVNAEGGLNIRSSYSASSSLIGRLPDGVTVTITKEKFTKSDSTARDTRWFYVKSDYGNGYVCGAYIGNVSYPTVNNVVTASVPVRTGAGPGFTKVGTLSKGDTAKVRLKVITKDGVVWYKITYGGQYRYIHGGYIDAPEPVTNTNFSNELNQFPSSYRPYLKKLHEKYPSWHFKAKKVGYTWTSALDAQYSNYKANTIPSNKKAAYKDVRQGTYNFTNHTYIGLDGSGWVGASRKAVGYYMDPRNWLDEINVFMFESLSYDATTQKESMVKQILANTAIPTSASTYYMTAGKNYDISPVYLAAKSRIELGTSDYMVSGTKFTYNGKTYKGFYNAYNIGASDSSSGDAAKKGLVYAGSGSTYLRPWTSLSLAIRGGAKFIAEDFIGNNQHTLYYERFNVANGLSSVGTHQYMTNTMAAATQANITYWNYKDNGMIDTPFTFEIPVYNSMPASRAAAPGSGNNNCYLDTLKVYEGSTRRYFTVSFDRFTKEYKLKTTVTADDLTIKTTTNDSDAKVTVTGNKNLKDGENRIKVAVKASSGLTRYYYITVNKKPTVKAPTLTVKNNPDTGKPVLTWSGGRNVDKYQVYRSTRKDSGYVLLTTLTGSSFTNTGAVAGTEYYYKVKAIGTTGVIGEAYSSSVVKVCDIPRPVVKAANAADSGKVKLTWAAVKGASKYEVYRAKSENGTYTKMYTTTGTTYTNTSAQAGVKYYYKVKAISSKTSYADSAYSKVVSRVCDLPRPVVKAGNDVNSGKVKLTWNAVNGASKYEVYRAKSENGTYSKMYTTKGTSYTNSGYINAGVKYYYKVKAVSGKTTSANSAYSKVVYRVCDLPRPVVKAGNDVNSGKVKLTWSAIDGASKYEVYRAKSQSGTYTKMYTTTKTSYINTSSAVGVKYYYKVKAISPKTSSGNSAFSKVVYRVCDLSRPVVKVQNVASSGKVKLTWTAVDGASKYEVYRAKSKSGTYTKMYTTKGTSYTNTSASAGVKYYYKVKAVYDGNSSANSAFSSVIERTCDLPAPVIERVTSSADGKPQIHWEAVDGASKYVVYRAASKDGTYNKMYTTTGRVYTNTSAVSGKTYYYKVIAVSPKTSAADSSYSKIVIKKCK